nr:hypothetical protein [Mammaliicoccus sp. Marseille-Q6498]
MTKIYRVSIIIIAIISSILIMFSDAKKPDNLILLPLLFALLIIIVPSFTKYMFKNIGITIVNISMLIRYIITPTLISIYGVDLNRGQILLTSVQNKAVYLMMYEMIVIFILYAIFYKNFYTDNIVKKAKEIKSSSNIFGWLFVLLCIAILISNPAILSRYSFVWTASELKSKVVEGVSVSFFLTVIQLGHLVLTVNLLNMIHKFYEKKNRFVYVVISIIVVMISASFMVGTSRFSIILPLVTGLFTILKLYRPYAKVIGLLSFVVSFVFIIVSTALKQSTISGETGTSSNSSIFEGLNSDLQIYFSGVSNVAHSLNTRFIYEPFDFMAILSDLTRSVMYVNSWFGTHISALNQFNVTFYGGGTSQDQILPMIGQGYLYFGFILAPILTGVTIIMVMYLDKIIQKSSSVFNVYIITYLCLKFALYNMANATILLSFMTNFFLILLFIVWLNKLIKVR